MVKRAVSTLPIGTREIDVLGSRLKAIRCAISKERKPFAEMFGVSEQKIKRYETGQSIIPLRLVRDLHAHPLTGGLAFILLLPVFNTSEWLMVNALSDVLSNNLKPSAFRPTCEIKEP